MAEAEMIIRIIKEDKDEVIDQLLLENLLDFLIEIKMSQAGKHQDCHQDLWLQGDIDVTDVDNLNILLRTVRVIKDSKGLDLRRKDNKWKVTIRQIIMKMKRYV